VRSSTLGFAKLPIALLHRHARAYRRLRGRGLRALREHLCGSDASGAIAVEVSTAPAVFDLIASRAACQTLRGRRNRCDMAVIHSLL
jgi:hypothetical protein